MAFKNKSQGNPTLPKIAAPPIPKPITPKVPGKQVAAPGGLPNIMSQAKGFGKLAVQQPWRPRRQQLLTPGMPQASPYPEAVRTF